MFRLSLRRPALRLVSRPAFRMVSTLATSASSKLRVRTPFATAMKSVTSSSTKLTTKAMYTPSVVRLLSGGGGHDDHHHHHEMSSYLAREEVIERLMPLLKTLDKLKVDKLTEEAHFTNDLGLDSLDTVETVVAIEEEFGAVFPDEVAEQIESVKDVIEVLCATPNLASIHAAH